jgi:hypothetical protein
MMLVRHRKLILTTMASYDDSFTFLCVDDVRTSQEKQLWATTAYYGDSCKCYRKKAVVIS